jgi:protein-disulfide isomerase
LVERGAESVAKDRKRRTPRREKGETERPPASATVAWGAVALALVAMALGVAALVLHFADEGGEEGGPAVGQSTPTVQPTTPTPPPAVAASADDDPFIGPADAPVTIIEFSDYQ